MKTLCVFLTIILSCTLLFTVCGSQNTLSNQYTITVYTRSDACGAAQVWAEYLGKYNQEDLKGTAVFGDPGIAEAVRKDSHGIGYNNIGFAYDLKTGKPVVGLAIIPIDRNENGIIDPDESFYATKEQLVEAIASGKYPSPPARDLYLVTQKEFSGITGVFVRWILNDGQKYVDEIGYVGLSREKIAANLKTISSSSGSNLQGTITISGAFALYPMMQKWADEFQKVYPNIRFDISAGGAGKGMTDAIGGMVDLGMVSREIYPAEIEKGIAFVPVTRDAVVAVANEANPVLIDLLGKGLSRQIFTDIWVNEKITDWKTVIAR